MLIKPSWNIYATHIGKHIWRIVNRITKCGVIRIVVAKLCKIALLPIDVLVRHTKAYWILIGSNRVKVNVLTGVPP